MAESWINSQVMTVTHSVYNEAWVWHCFERGPYEKLYECSLWVTACERKNNST